EAREGVKALCEPVEPPRDAGAYLRFFRSPDNADADAVKDAERKRVTLYKLVGSFVRAYAEIANEMEAAGYGPIDAAAVKGEVTHFEQVREEVKLASGDYIDLKVYEPAMRHLLDS